MIRYFRYPGYGEYIALKPKSDSSYIVTELDGYIKKSIFQASSWIEEDPKYMLMEIPAPDAGPIEERHINATDRPSVDDFKYPELQPLSNTVSSIYEIRVRPKHTTKNCTIGSKVRLYDGREGE